MNAQCHLDALETAQMWREQQLDEREKELIHKLVSLNQVRGWEKKALIKDHLEAIDREKKLHNNQTQIFNKELSDKSDKIKSKNRRISKV